MTHPNDKRPADIPATPAQLAAAMTALGYDHGTNTEAEHEQESARLGSTAYYRMLLANALLGCAEAEALRSDSTGPLSPTQLLSAHHHALVSAGVADEPAKLLQFLRWRTLRVAGPLREMAQDQQTGPLVLAAAHAAEGLQRLVQICAAGQEPLTADPRALRREMREARDALSHAITNIDIMRDLLQQAEDLFSQ